MIWSGRRARNSMHILLGYLYRFLRGSEDHWVRSKKGISSSLATLTNVVDCVPGGQLSPFRRYW
jgi:hypothetical protein